MASSKNQKYEDAASKYNTAAEQYTGQRGYEAGLKAASNGTGLADQQINAGNKAGLNTAAQANRANSNIYNSANMNLGAMNNAINTYGQNMAQQQNSMTAANNAGVSAMGTQMGAAQQEGQNEYNRKNANWGLGIGLLTSDEKLKHYKECSKKVVIKSPNSIQKLKFVKEN